MFIDSRQGTAVVPNQQQHTEYGLRNSGIANNRHNRKQVPKQLGYWLQYQIQRIPGRVIMALINRFSVNTVSYCFDLLVLSAGLLVNRKIATVATEVAVTETGRYIVYIGSFGVSALCHLGIYQLRGKFNHHLENVVIQALDEDDEPSHAQQLLTRIGEQVECEYRTTEKLLQAMASERLSSVHLRVILELFKEALKITMGHGSIELLKMRNILTTLSVHPELAAAAATQTVLQMGECHDTTLKILDQINIWTMAETMFEPLESGHDTSWHNLLLRIQSVYNEWVLIETLYSVKYNSWLTLSGDRPLAEHYQSALIYTIYKKILAQSGVCTFLSPPSQILYEPLLCHFVVSDARVFYQFLGTFRQRLYDTDAFFRFTKNLMIEKESVLLQRNPQLRWQINKKRDQNAARFDHLRHLQAQGRINENEYLEYSQDLMNKHNQAMDKIWLHYISRAFSNIPARLKNSGNNRRIAPNLSLKQLVCKYNKPDALV